VKLIADLRPLVIACGHGIPMSGDKAVRELAELAANLPMPAHGRYIPEAARTDENGVVWLPPKPADRLPGAMLALGIATAAGTMFAVAARRRKRSSTADTPEQAS